MLIKWNSPISVPTRKKAPPVEIDGNNSTIPVRAERHAYDPPEQSINDSPAAADNNTGVLGAALGVAVGAGIAGLAALLT